MRREMSLIPLILLLLPLVMSSITLEAQAQITPTHNIAVSVPSLGGIVREVGGSFCGTTILLEQEIEPHDITVTPEMIAKADAADLLVITGHFEWELSIAEQTSTPFIAFHDDNAWENFEDYGAEYSPMPGDVDGDVHDHEGNPHGFWLLPKNALAIANATRAALTTLNVTLTNEWTNNFESFAQSIYELNELIDSLDDIYGFSEMSAVVASPSEAYVAEAFGISCKAVLQVGFTTIDSLSLLEVQNGIRNGSINLIIGSDVAQFQTGGELAYQLQTDYGGILIWWKTIFFAEADYFWMMNYNLGALVSGLEGRSGDVTDNTVNIGLMALTGVLGIMIAIESILLIKRARAE